VNTAGSTLVSDVNWRPSEDPRELRIGWTAAVTVTLVILAVAGTFVMAALLVDGLTLLGLFVGLAEWPIIRKRVRGGEWFVAASAAGGFGGRAIGLTLTGLASGLIGSYRDPTFVIFAEGVSGACIGFGIAVGQCLILRGRSQPGHFWTVAGLVGGAAYGVVGAGLTFILGLTATEASLTSLLDLIVLALPASLAYAAVTSAAAPTFFELRQASRLLAQPSRRLLAVMASTLLVPLAFPILFLSTKSASDFRRSQETIVNLCQDVVARESSQNSRLRFVPASQLSPTGLGQAIHRQNDGTYVVVTEAQVLPTATGAGEGTEMYTCTVKLVGDKFVLQSWQPAPGYQDSPSDPLRELTK